MDSIVRVLKGFRARWRYKPQDDTELNKCFAITFQQEYAKVVLDYLIETYYKPLDFLGPCDSYKLAERNGHQQVLADIMLRFDKGSHPGAFEGDKNPDKPFDTDPRRVDTGPDPRKI